MYLFIVNLERNSFASRKMDMTFPYSDISLPNHVPVGEIVWRLPSTP